MNSNKKKHKAQVSTTPRSKSLHNNSTFDPPKPRNRIYIYENGASIKLQEKCLLFLWSLFGPPPPFFDPFDDTDRMVDTDGDGHVNYCEYKWDTNPRDINSFPGQGQLCNPFEE